MEVGQEMFAVYNGGRKNKTPITISKIGRKWVYFANGNGRFSIDEMRICGGVGYGSVGKVYYSEADYEEEKLTQSLYSELNKRMGHTPPKGVTVDRIELAAASLGIKLPTPDKERA